MGILRGHDDACAAKSFLEKEGRVVVNLFDKYEITDMVAICMSEYLKAHVEDVNASGWINVNDRLPKLFTSVLAEFVSEGQEDMGTFIYRGDTWIFPPDGRDVRDLGIEITAWREMPGPSKRKK